jgi:hypothetical protein
VTNNTTSDSTDFWGGLSTELTDISKADKSDLIIISTGNNAIFGGLSTK